MIDATNEVTFATSGMRLNPIGIAVHHTVTRMKEDATEDQERAHIRAIDAYHLSQWEIGFGYHAILFPSGRAYWCGDPAWGRAHVARRNHELMGLAVVGDFRTQIASPALLQRLEETLAEMDLEKKLPIAGHQQWNLPGENTECPAGILEQLDRYHANNEQPPLERWWPVDFGHVLPVAYVGFLNSNKAALSERDKKALDFLAMWYRS